MSCWFIHWKQKKSSFVHFVITCYYKNILMGWCKKGATALLMPWSWVFLALTHQYGVISDDNFSKFPILIFSVASGFDPSYSGFACPLWCIVRICMSMVSQSQMSIYYGNNGNRYSYIPHILSLFTTFVNQGALSCIVLNAYSGLYSIAWAKL